MQNHISNTSLKQNISWTFLGNAVYAGCQWAMLVLLAKLTDPKTVGQFALSLAITAPVFAFTNLQLREIQATDVNNDHHYTTYFGFRILSSLLALVVIVFIAIFSDYSPQTTSIIIIIGVSKVIESLSDVIYGLMQKHEQMRTISTSMLIKGPLSLAAFASAVIMFHNLIAGVVALVVAWAISFFFYDFKHGRRLMKYEPAVGNPVRKLPFMEYKRLLMLALPMGFVILLNTLNFNIPRYQIAELFGESTLGYYSAIASLLIVGSTIVNAIGQSATPRLAKYYFNNRVAYVRLLIKSLCLVAIIGLLGILFSLIIGRQLLTILYTTNYANHNDVLIWTMIGALALYCSAMVGCGITATRSYFSQLFFGICVTSTVFITSFLFVPRFGMIGGSIALLIGFTVKFIAQAIQVVYLIRRV